MKTVIAFLAGICLMAAVGALAVPGEIVAQKITLVDNTGVTRATLAAHSGGATIRLLNPQGGNALIISTGAFENGTWCANVYTLGPNDAAASLGVSGLGVAHIGAARVNAGQAALQYAPDSGGRAFVTDAAGRVSWETSRP